MIRHKPRSGFTMIELTAVMAVTGVLLVIAVTWIGETMKFSSRMKSHQNQHSQLTRLGRSFRLDVQMSQTMTLENETRLVLQQSNGRQIVYTISGTTVDIEKTKGSELKRDQFRLSSNSVVEWDIRELPETIGLIVFRRPIHASDSKTSQKATIENAADGEDYKLPVDIHLVAQINRWPVEYSLDNNRGAK